MAHVIPRRSSVFPATAVGGAREPELQVSLDPSGKVLYISADAAMPVVRATCVLRGAKDSDPKPSSWEWNVSLVMQPGGAPYSVGRSTAHTPIRETTFSPEFLIPFRAVRGGLLTVKCSTTYGNRRLSAFKAAEIRGTNPSEVTLRAAGASEVLILIMKQETQLRQFRTGAVRQGYPLFSADGLGGVGIGQVTHPRPTDEEIWSWKANLARAQTLYQEKRRMAIKYLDAYPQSAQFKRLVAQYKADRLLAAKTAQTAGSNPVGATKQGQQATPLSQAAVQALDISLPSYTEEMLENETIRLYNGQPSDGPLEYGAKLDKELLVVQVSSDGKHGKAEWQEVSAQMRTSIYTALGKPERKWGDPDYVSHVRSQGAP